MAGKMLTKDKYEQLVAAFRETPDRPYTVCKKVGVTGRTAIKAWEVGWPQKGYEPIKTVMQREQVKARAEIIAQQASKKAFLLKEREDAIAHAAQSRAQEGQMVGLARGGALQAMTVSVNLAGSARKLASQVKAKIDALAELDPTDPLSLAPAAGLQMLHRLAELMQKINQIAETSMRMERLHLGEPTQVVGHVITSQTEMTIDEAGARIEMAQKALDNARRVGGLSVIDGGLSKPVIGKLITVQEVPEDHIDEEGGTTSQMSNIS